MTTPLTTTLATIKAHGPCAEGWRTLRDSLPGFNLATPFPLAHILDSNGLDHAIWALRVLGDDPIARLFAADCAEHVLHLWECHAPGDNRPRLAIEAARQYAAIQLGAPGNLTTARNWMEATARGASWASAAAAAAATAAGWASGAAAATATAAGWASGAAERDWQGARLRAYDDGLLPAPLVASLGREA